MSFLIQAEWTIWIQTEKIFFIFKVENVLRFYVFTVRKIVVSDKGDSKCLTFQAASEEEFKRWQQLVSCNTGGNPRVYVDAGSGAIAHASHNIELCDHIVGKALFDNSQAKI